MLPIAQKWDTLARLLQYSKNDISNLAKEKDDKKKLEHIIRDLWKPRAEDSQHRREALIRVLGEMSENDLAVEVWKGTISHKMLIIMPGLICIALKSYPEMPGATGEGEVRGEEKKDGDRDGSPSTPYSTPDSEIPALTFPVTTGTLVTTTVTATATPVSTTLSPR